MTNILIVETSSTPRKITQAGLGKMGFQVTACETTEHALTLLQSGKSYKLIGANLGANKEGIYFLKAAQELCPGANTFLMTTDLADELPPGSAYLDANGVAQYAGIPTFVRPINYEQMAAALNSLAAT